MAMEKRNELIDTLYEIIKENEIFTIQQWKNTAASELKIQLMKEHGLSVNSYVEQVIDIFRTDTIQEIKTTSMIKLITNTFQNNMEYILNNIDNMISGVEWIYHVFKENKIDIVEFLSWCTLIKNCTIQRVNTLIIQGDTGTGKTMTASTLLKPLKLETVPKEHDNSTFNLDQIPAASGILFEEPIITPTNVNRWKLILEGNTTKTDIKHSKIKEEITRIPVYITTGTNIEANVNYNESQQLKQRYVIYYFTKKIRHLESDKENECVTPPPVYIEPVMWTVIFALKNKEIKEKINKIIKQNI